VQTLNDNPSLITRAATFWGGLPMWEKILVGVGVSGVPLAVGLVAHLGVLLVIGSTTGVVYTAGSIVLDDHHTNNVNIARKVEEGVMGLADILGYIIDLLDKIREQFAHEIERFKLENSRLTDNIDNLQDQVENLGAQVELFRETERVLKEIKEGLEKTAIDLAQSTVKQTELLEQNERQLTEIRRTYEKSQLQLGEKVVELNGVKEQLTLKVKQANLVAQTLQGTVETLTGTVISDTQDRQMFQQKLDGFLKDKEGSFDTVSSRIVKAEEELLRVKEQLNESNLKYKELLKRQEDQVSRLEQLNKSVIGRFIVPTQQPTQVPESLHTLGFHAPKKMSVKTFSDETPSLVPVLVN
jgi:chromosome segregation ATPase